MTNRYPLIIDPADGNKIKELPAGDNLNLLNNSILGVQDITALGTIDAAIIRVAGQRILAQTFTDLSDTPNNYTGAASSFVKVNSAGTALEFADLADLGDITVGNVTVESGNIVPAVDNTRQIGTAAKKFTQIHAVDVYSNLRGRDGSLVFDASNSRIPYAAIFGAPTALSEFTNDMGFVDSAGIGDAIDSYLSDSTNTVANRLVNGLNELVLESNGALSYPKSALQRDTSTVNCLGNASTVVYTGSANKHTIRLLIQVEGNVGAAVDWDTQSCEMIIAKSWRADDVAATVYAVVHTSVAPLATFSAEWNALTSRVEVLCTTPSANTVYVRTFATEITTAD
jgi:hypothetical protein